MYNRVGQTEGRGEEREGEGAGRGWQRGKERLEKLAERKDGIAIMQGNKG